MTSSRTLRLPGRRRGRLALWLLVGLSVLFFLISPLIQLLAEWPWFSALGYERVFATRLIASLLLGIVAGGAAFALLYANLRFAQRGIVPNPVVMQMNAQTPAVDVTRLVRRLALPAALVLALFIALAMSSGWMPVLQFLNQTPFGVTDPVFGRDVGYYVFTLPIVGGVLGLLMFLVVVALLASGALYALRGDVVIYRKNLTIEPSARLHLAVLLAVLFVLTALRVYFVRLPGTLFSTNGPLFGASYANLHGTIIGLKLAGLAALVGAALVVAGARSKRLGRNALLAVAIYFGVSLLGVVVYPAVVQRLIVAPNELNKETPQLRYHIDATRRAWGLDRVLVRDLSGEAALTERDIQANRTTIDNVRLWDRDPLLQTFGQLQEIRTYYDFVSVDDDRYMIDGRYRQVMLSPRELNSASLPTRTFINERLTFTHGMGLTLGPVNEVTEEGLPVLFVKNLPPASTVSVAVRRPEIYFGELTDTWVFANTGQAEFDYPSGDENIFASYKGNGGVRVGGFLRRLVLSAYFRSLKVLLSSDITSQSRAMYIRNIRQRARTALPFLIFDADPYMVIDAGGRLRWILDGYTATTRYPYAEPLQNGVNYMRNSVKVVIDAYDGTVTAYLADPADPLVRTFAKIFAGIFQPLDSMPADLRAHLRYPEDLFHVQSELYGAYHMAEPDIFYHREDQWQKPVLSIAPERPDPFLRHMVMRLPEERQAEFILMVPFTPRGKDNLASWMVARNDGEHYGELVVYRFPKQSLVFGPTQIVNRINQDTEIARQVALWDQGGSQVIRGNLLVIPLEESLIYVMPLYLRAQGGRIPELKRVVVAYQNRVVMEETLDAGLAQLFGGGAEAGAARAPARVAATPGAAPATNARAADLARRANESYRRALEAQRAGDWARYGEELRRLEDLLRQLQTVLGGRE
ncbi:MAG TPA: UPF0182 family protein [Gemmatimonadales bacterium]|nr:UPF0182 family protein [Gemmatimonadales bacterium]